MLVDNFLKTININHIYTHYVDSFVHNLEFSQIINNYVSAHLFFFVHKNNHCYCW